MENKNVGFELVDACVLCGGNCLMCHVADLCGEYCGTGDDRAQLLVREGEEPSLADLV